MHIRKFIGMTALAGAMAFAQQSTQPSSTQSPKPSSTPSTQSSDQQSTTGKTSTAGTAGAASTESMLGPQDKKFLDEAARGGMMEVQVAQMAQQKASSSEVKEFARQLEQDHAKANEKLKAIAQERGVSLPTDLGQHEKMVTALNSASGEEFDKQFMKMQVQHHKKDVKAFRKESQNSIDTDLREFATASLPTLEAHLQKAQSLSSQTGSRARKQ